MKPHETFWRRAGARLIDVVVFIPDTVVSLYLLVRGMSYSAYVGLCILQLGIGVAYWGGLHYWRGQTLGKLVMRLKVVRVDGQPLELSDVLVRHFPQFLTGLLSVVPLLWLLREDSVISFQMIAECQSTPVTLLIGIWGIAQLIVVLSNDRRRAIHDFLAETEVLKLG